MSHRPCRWLLVSAALLATAGFAPAPAAAQGASPLPACHGLRWIANAGSLRRSQADFPLAQQRQYLGTPCTFLVGGRDPGSDYRDWDAVRTGSVTRLQGLAAVARNPAVAAVLYDPEAWPMTPREEQLDPVAATCKAATIVHAQGKLLIATPAIDLIRVIEPGADRDGQRFAAFERLGLAGRIARCADVYEIQAQGAEADAAKFRDFVRAEAQQARAANPRVIVLAGISTNPSGRRVDAQQVYAAVQATRNGVDGYWLNIPAGGKYCPRCGEPQPQVARQLLQRLAAEGGR